MKYVNMWCIYVVGILYLTTFTSGDQPKIIIIGAGAAGIAAASKLFENGFENVTILEAENRIGGRVHTIKFHDTWIDLGGQWVHGQVNNTAFELAWPLGILEVPEGKADQDVIIYDSKGGHVPDSIGKKLLESFEDASSSLADSTGNNGSVGEYMQRAMDTEIRKYPGLNETLIRGFMKLFEDHVMAEEAADNWWEISARGQVEAWACSGSPVVNWKDKGYGTILDILMKKFPNPEEELPVLNNTLLNTEVVNVNYESLDGKALVKTSDGEEYIADHVIMTPSLGVLKEKYETLFTPQLTESKVNTIKGLAFGTAAKIYFAFDVPWWPNDFPHHVFVWDEEDRKEYENDPNTKWLVDILGIFTVAHKPKLLYSWLGGAGSRYMETLPEAQVLNQTFELMNKFLGKSYNITRPVGIKRSTWYHDKNFRGTYSFRSMESERADVWASGLATPLLIDDKPIVMFAGEATDSHHYGNVHAAIDSGFREADRLIKIYNNATK